MEHFSPQVSLGKFHSVWVCSKGEAWCCGQLARAGGPPSTALRPTLLKLPEKCTAVALTLTSTVFLMESGMVSMRIFFLYLYILVHSYIMVLFLVSSKMESYMT